LPAQWQTKSGYKRRSNHISTHDSVRTLGITNCRALEASSRFHTSLAIFTTLRLSRTWQIQKRMAFGDAFPHRCNTWGPAAGPTQHANFRRLEAVFVNAQGAEPRCRIVRIRQAGLAYYFSLMGSDRSVPNAPWRVTLAPTLQPPTPLPSPGRKLIIVGLKRRSYGALPIVGESALSR
jgi:hypothetical protein